MKLLWCDVCIGKLSTHDAADNVKDDSSDNNNKWRTIHDYIGFLAFMPNEPKTPFIHILQNIEAIN